MTLKEARRRLGRRRLGVLMGGWSAEREVSLRSGAKVLDSLGRQGFDAVGIDITREFAADIARAGIGLAFVMLHGRPGEDGTIQGFLELAGIPYTGSGVAASAVGMDKRLSKTLFERAGIPTPEFVAPGPGEDPAAALGRAERAFGFPMVVKPAAEGSSVGVEILRGPRGALAACRRARRHGDILLERFVPGMEATVGIVGREVLPILELVPKRRAFYDYKAKYTRGATEFILPARLAPRVARRVGELALRAHDLLGCRDLSRVDFIIEAGRRPRVLEVNTLPGMTDISDLPAEAAAAGIGYDELVLRILAGALGR
ncbi:MAG TPA: D-alanine--D-alanine ligase [candidate division WOR-3 bacterium]|uniref:D-alanine--D-alanine ligase n=1 Tax=candidate division WOR-3 bacterium TaxID=2052148 RepID=A0A7V0XEW5_UNCW3|nr:D-alanine--D-alanine ligase [candidate division WOR-3 bacterium]